MVVAAAVIGSSTSLRAQPAIDNGRALSDKQAGNAGRLGHRG
jgi:hypothetical protein